MKIIRKHRNRPISLEKFADQHGLTLEVNIYHRGEKVFYTAWFPRVELSEGCVLRSCLGSGDSEAEAIRDYTQRLSGQKLVIDGGRRTRKEVCAPTLTVKGQRGTVDTECQP
ncbi:MAG: hypothetical protein ABFE07_28450 [Armatimonadia bacterium]